MSEKCELLFEPVDLESLDRIRPYTSAYGEDSCQHSPVSMFALQDKNGDSCCILDGFLYVLRSRLCDEKYRVYLAPLGEGDRTAAYARILDDAHRHGKKAKFLTLTGTHAAYLEQAFPGRFRITYSRDLSEYIYEVETFAQFPGKFHERRRRELRAFWRDYGGRVSVQPLREADLGEVLAFSEAWTRERDDTHEVQSLEEELHCIHRQFANFRALGLSGTVIRIDGQIRGFCSGAPLNERCYDVLTEKGTRSIAGIYRVIRQESARLNLESFQYVNFEEDIGVPGLRQLKESYGPAFLIEKYIAAED